MDIKEELTKKSLIYYILLSTLVFTVFVDLFNGFIKQYLGIDFSIGAVYRISIIFILFPFFFKVKENFFKYFMYILLSSWFICQVIWISYYINYQSFYSFRFESETMLKYILVYFILAFLLVINEKYTFSIKKLLSYAITWSTIASSAVIFSSITGLGLKSYEGASNFGTSSFFIAINDISLTILVTFPFVVYSFLEEYSKKNLLNILIHITALFLIASRSASIGGIGVIIIYAFALMFYKKISIKAKLLYFTGSVITLSIVITSFIFLVLSENYLLEKVYALTQEKPRGKLEEVAKNRISNRDEIQQIFGEGFYSYSKNIESTYYHTIAKENQFAEVDPVDAIGFGGYLLGSIVMFFPVFMYLKSMYIFISSKSMINFTFFISISLYIFHSMVAGHALTNTYIQGVLGIIYFYLIKKYKEEKITSTNKN